MAFLRALGKRHQHVSFGIVGTDASARDVVGDDPQAGQLPVDAVVAREFKAGAASETVPVEDVPDDAMILDAGPQSVIRIKEWIGRAATLVWNGPLGAFEIAPFDKATMEAARFAAAETKSGNLVSVAGGGDTVSALNLAGAADYFSYVSTAGGSFLEWMEGKELPGVAALSR